MFILFTLTLAYLMLAAIFLLRLNFKFDDTQQLEEYKASCQSLNIYTWEA